MSRRSPAIALLALAAGLGPASAAWADQGVAAQFDAFAPSQLDVLPGEAVTWTNVSTRTHTVNADAGEFASGDLVAAATFSVRFDAPGAHPYHCMLHPGMVGEVDVRPVILDALPPAAVPAGQHVTLSGRTADPGEAVRVERSTGGGPFDAVATAAPSGDGRWRVAVPATATADYRAVSAAGTSETRRLLVSDRRVAIAATRAGVRVRVTPSVPYGRIVLERRERERFGWWPVRRARLDYLSEAQLRVRHGGRVRVVLVGRDGWTPLATSPVLRLRAAGAGAA